MNRKILLIEDEGDMAELLSQVLRSGGHDVTVAPDGRSGLRLFLGGRYDLIVLDLRLPKVDGVTFLGIVRAYLRYAEVPIIVVTASGDDDELDRLLPYNVRRVFKKGHFAFEELLDEVAAPPFAA